MASFEKVEYFEHWVNTWLQVKQNLPPLDGARALRTARVPGILAHTLHHAFPCPAWPLTH